ncbi:glycoside hydrolase family 97 protein [Lacipirellula sp.]|uniref:glycoside hydrolase family 97 protein n=1 Tax=Lacipirellula sp. TaxID=2691419 RepID=UPI003D126EDA
MKFFPHTWSLLLLSCFAMPAAVHGIDLERVESPSGDVAIAFSLNEQSAPQFEASYRDEVVAKGRLGLNFAGAKPLKDGLKVLGVQKTERDETYEIPVGKTSSSRDQSRRMVVKLQEAASPQRRVDVEFHVADDGIAFRYQLPEQTGLQDITLLDELTEVTFAGDPEARILPLNGYTTPYEKLYLKKRVSEITPQELVGLPMLLAIPAPKGVVWGAFTEANLHDYAGMYLAGAAGKPGTLASKLSPHPKRKDGAKVIAKKSLTTPWRVLLLADDPGRLIESNLIFNLNEPSKIADASWIKPGRTTFPWWNGYVLEDVDFEPGLNTATHKHYIDFCAEHGIEYHSIDGTNDQAWYGGPIAPNGPTDVTKSIPEIDMPELLRYAKEKGVRLRLWMHWKALQPQLDEALQVYEDWGIEGIMIDFMDRDDQEMVAFYHEVSEKAAKHHLTVNWHGAYKPTGMERTWPNVLNYEAALNQEYNKWDKVGTPPEHNLNIAFIRTIAGPVDYHQGGMRNVMPEDLKVQNDAPLVQGTRGHQLAMFVIYENHLPMLADCPAAYRGQDGLDFMTTVPANWDETRVLKAELDRVLVIARRRGDVWYVGGMTGREAAAGALDLSFLGEGEFDATVLEDVDGETTKLVKRTEQVDANGELKFEMPRGGGFVATIRKK